MLDEDYDIENQLVQHAASIVVSESAFDGHVTVQDVQKAVS